MVLNTENIILENKDIHLKKGDEGFLATINFVPVKGFSSTMLHSLKLKEPVKLVSESRVLYLPEHSLLISRHSLPSFDSLEYTLSGSISQITTIEDEDAYPEAFIRIIIPINEARPNVTLVESYFIKSDINNNHYTLIKVLIQEDEFHFYEFENDGNYLVIDSISKISFRRFKEIVRSITNAFSFISGKLFLDEGYFLFSKTNGYESIDDIYYTTFRESIKTPYPLYTTNPYSLYPITATDKEGIKKQTEEVNKWYEKLPAFPAKIFTTLCELFYIKEPFSRSAIVLLQANNLALEIKGSAYSVALETVTNQILKDNNISYPKPIEDPALADDLITQLKRVVDQMFIGDADENKTIRRIFHGKFNNINSPTNADKLSKPFELFNYTLSQYEIAVLKDRNQYQHGKLPAKATEDNVVFQEVYFSCLVLHRLISILILKCAGFSGFIINYPKLHEHITGRPLNEDLFYKI